MSSRSRQTPKAGSSVTNPPDANGVLGDLQRQGLLAPAKVLPKVRLPRRKPMAKIDEVLRDLENGRAER